MIGSYESISQFENAIRGKNTLFYRPVNFIFVFISIILGDGSKKIFLHFMLESVVTMFSLHMFILYICLQLQWMYGFEFLSYSLKVLCNHLAY